MTVKYCERFKVRCDPAGVSCDACVIHTWALEREAERVRVEARRRERVEEVRRCSGTSTSR